MSRPDRWLLCDPYCAQFKTYHDEMKENEDTSRKPQALQKKCWCGRVYYGERCKEGHDPFVTEAELARVAELDAKATQGPMHVGYDGPSRPIIISADTREPMLSISALNHGRPEPYEKEDADCELFAEYRTLTPRLARELAAARAAIKVAREWIEDAPHSPLCSYKPPLWRTELEDAACVCECDCGREDTLSQLNTHTHE